MPPEPVPYDRKEFVFKERKHDRVTAQDTLAGGNCTPRWRDPPYRASPRRPPPSYYKQSGSFYQQYEEANGHGCTLSRSEDVFRPSNGRYNGVRSRENRGNYRNSPYHEAYSPTSPAIIRQLSPPPQSQRSELMSWKPVKWSGQSRKAGRSEAEEGRNVILDGVVEKTSEEVGVVEEEVPRKKSRLTWGQGLAKYEKQKVVGGSSNTISESSTKVAGSMSPDTPSSATPCVTSGADEAGRQPFSKATNVDNEASHQPFSKAANADNEESHQPIVKPTNVDSDASHQPSCNATTVEIDASHHSEVSSLNNCSEQLPIKLDQLPSITELISLLNDLLQPEEACTGDSTPNKNNTTHKLELLKAEIPKELEKTESEIDLLENELKSLNKERESSLIEFPVPKTGSSSTPCSEPSNVEVSSNEPNILTCSSAEHESEVKIAIDASPAAPNDIELVPAMNEDSSSADANLDGSSSEMKNNNLVDLVMDSDRDAAKKASQVFYGVMPATEQKIDIWDPDIFLACRKNDIRIMEKLGEQKCQLKFKERVLALKFKALHHMWKDDLRFLSVRKQRPKSQKRIELCSRSSQSSSQKQRASIRSRFASPAGYPTLSPTVVIEEYTSKLLSDSQIKLYRKNLKMPALILDENDRKFSKFMTSNGLIEDPLAIEKERLMINPWTEEEKGVFMEMLATYGKDFAKVSSFLTHKTTADCIEFYYKNHKSESFRDVKKHLNMRKQSQSLPTNTYLLTSGTKRWNRDSNAASLDMLGTVSLAVAHNNCNNPRNQIKFHSTKVSRTSFSSLDISGYEKETEVVSSCVTSSISPPEKMTTPDVNQTIEEEDICSDEGINEIDSVDWTDEEKSVFIRALSLYGKDFPKISECVGTKSRDQCRVFFSKARKCLGLDSINPIGNGGTTPASDGNGGRSDTDESVANTGGNNSMQNEIDMSSMQQYDVEKNETERQVIESVDGAVGKNSEPEASHAVEKLHIVEAKVEVDTSCNKEQQLETQTTIDEMKVNNEVEAQQVTVASDKSFSSDIALAKEPDSFPNHIFDFSTKQQTLPRKLLSCSQKKSKQENIYPVPLSTVLPDPSSICIPSTIHFNEHLQKLHQGSAAKDLYQQCLSRINFDQSSHILCGYPLNREKPKPILSENHFNRFFDSSSHSDKGKGSVMSDSLSNSSQETEKQTSNRTGDVKLFGQILKTESKRESKSAGITNSTLEDIPLQKSYGFWDGTQIRTGFSSLPESTIILASSQGVNSPNGVATSFQQTFVQPLSSNGKRSGFELVSGFQQRRSAIARLGVNVVNASGVSDPVAALKMAKLYSGEMESWSRDLNGR